MLNNCKQQVSLRSGVWTLTLTSLFLSSILCALPASAAQTNDPNPGPAPVPSTGQKTDSPDTRSSQPPADGRTPPVKPATVETRIPAPVTLPRINVKEESALFRPLSPDEAVRIALRRQPTIINALANVRAAQGRSQQARSGLYPTLNLSTAYTNATPLTGTTSTSTNGSTSAAVGTTATGYQLTAQVRQLLFDFNHTRDLVRQAQALELSASRTLTRTENDLALQVKNAYYGLVQNQRLVAVNQQNVENRQSQRALALARLNSGLGLPSDLVTAETTLSDSVVSLNLAQNNAEIAKVNLALQMGIDPRTPVITQDISEPALAGSQLNNLVDTALRQRPEILAAQAVIDANRSGVSAAKSTNAPVFAGLTGVNGRGGDSPFRTDGFTVGISINFSPFDGGLTAGKVREAQANLTSAEAALQANRLAVISDVSQAYLNLASSIQRVDTAQTAVTNAQEGVRIAEGRYRSGLGLFLDIINAQALLLTSRTNLVNALAAVDQARSALRHAIGETAK